MNKTKPALYRYAIFLLLSLYNLALVAQPITDVHKNNLSQFVAEMEQYFGQAMTVTGAQINQFMQPFVIGGNTTTCSTPNPVVTSEDPQQISFEWAGLPFGDYRVGYLNLLTGDHNVNVIDHSDHSFGVEDGLYIFVFQQICGTKKSNAVIIILDKVVALNSVPGMECDCSHTTLYVGAEVDELALSDYDEMDVLIRHTEYTGLVIFQMHMQRACPSCSDFDVNPDCLSDGTTTYINNINYLEIDETVGNVLTFSGADMNLAYDLPSNYEPVIALCKTSQPPNQSGTISLQVRPTIPGTAYQLKTQKEVAEIIQLTLFSQTGQLMQRFAIPQGSIGVDHEVDLSPYPAGIYFLRIEGANTNQIKKLIRH